MPGAFFPPPESNTQAPGTYLHGVLIPRGREADQRYGKAHLVNGSGQGGKRSRAKESMVGILQENR